MKQLKLDSFIIRGTAASNDFREYQRHQFSAFAEYEDVRQNVYIGRSRVIQGDDFPSCHCQPLPNWSQPCVSHCENRATQTECVYGHCSTRYKCGNQRIQHGIQAALAIESTRGKGIALMADGCIGKGEFVAQYVGEVMSKDLYFSREQKIVGSRHSYGMAVTPNEVIDARFIGGMARFANHSCSPNCDVERWDVAGEICCGLFANRSIARCEEITISYGVEFVQSKVR